MGFPSRELTRVLDQGMVVGSTAFEFGCGTGHNACLLAERGFQVTAVDGAALAIERARERAKNRGLEVEFLQADVCQLPDLGRRFDFIFDRGCFHCVRQNDVAGYLRSVQLVTRPGSRFLLLTGNANEQREGGPPRLHERELRADLEQLFVIDDLHEFRFDDPAGPTGPLAWSCLMTRKAI
ncbi:MAG: Methyltransferase [Planctomycetaceae bacterium]|nr:Methyltransferase [Planctomycetaceae bacterium]